MSIITDALKKAEKNSFQMSEKKEVMPFYEKTMSQDSPKALKRDRSPLFIFSILTILSIIFFLVIRVYDLTDFTFSINKELKLTENSEIKEFEQDSLREQVVLDKKKLRDDIIYSYTKPEAILSGIMYSENRPLAVVNDIIMKEGDEASGLRVIKIRPSSVDIENDGEIVTLRLKRQY